MSLFNRGRLTAKWILWLVAVETFFLAALFRKKFVRIQIKTQFFRFATLLQDSCGFMSVGDDLLKLLLVQAKAIFNVGIKLSFTGEILVQLDQLLVGIGIEVSYLLQHFGFFRKIAIGVTAAGIIVIQKSLLNAQRFVLGQILRGRFGPGVLLTNARALFPIPVLFEIDMPTRSC